jgi:Flp pilus assembly protein TadG
MRTIFSRKRRLGRGVAAHHQCALAPVPSPTMKRSRNRFAEMQSRLMHGHSGQSVLEMALVFPFLIVVAINAINVGYMFSLYLNLSAAPRQGAQYSIHGTSTALEMAVPSADSVSSLVYDNINTAVPAAANSPTQVCSMALGMSGSGATQVPNCATYNGGGALTFPAPQPDPEAPYMVLHRVDVQYTATPLVQGVVFNAIAGQVTLHKTVMMRAMP